MLTPSALAPSREAGATDDLVLTILIPCLNEAETLAACVRASLDYLAEAKVAGEVLVADNGSTDGSQAIAEGLGARVVETPVRGYGGALSGGIAAARGRYVIMGDADDSYDLRHLQPFIDKLEAGADLVMGNRFRGGIGPGAMPFLHRWLGNPVLTWIGRLLFGVPVGDFHCGLRGFRRDRVLALGLKTTGMEFASEMVVRASLQHFAIAEVPTTLRKDGRSRAPHLKTWRDGWRHLRFLLLHSPRWTFLYPGAGLMAAGLALAALLLAAGQVRLIGQAVLSTHTLLAAVIAVMLGIQLITFGVIARRFTQRNGILPEMRNLPSVLDQITVERLLLTAGAILFLGVAGSARLIGLSFGQDYGRLHPGSSLRSLIVICGLLASGVQLAFSALLLGVLDLPPGEPRT